MNRLLSLSFSAFLISMIIPATMALASGAKSVSTEGADPTYADGQAIYSGRKGGTKALAYCVEVGGDKKKLKARTIGQFKGKESSALVAKLYDCDQPDTLISQQITQNDLNAVVHYLDVRYELALQ